MRRSIYINEVSACRKFRRFYDIVNLEGLICHCGLENECICFGVDLLFIVDLRSSTYYDYMIARVRNYKINLF